MTRSFRLSLLILAVLVYPHLAVPRTQAAQLTQPKPALGVPRVIPINGLLRDRDGRPLSGVVGISFALYRDQFGGAPLWIESQNVQVDSGGYNTTLGVATAEGLPMELFSSGEARWLGVRPQIFLAEEQPRVLLVTVPYALKAGDADTIGGKPASAFVLAEADSHASLSTSTEKHTLKGSDTPTISSISGTGTANRLAKWLDADNVGASNVFENNGNVGINTDSPAGTLDVQGINSWFGTSAVGARLNATGGTNAGVWLRYLDQNMYVDSDQHTIFRVNGKGALPEAMRITSAGNVGIGTNAPAGTLDVRGVNSFFGVSGSGARLKATGGTNSGIWLRYTDQNTYIDSDENMVFRISGNRGLPEAMRITSSGDVGIGTTGPSAKMEVAGNLKISGGGNGLAFPDGSSITSANPIAAARIRNITYLAGCDTCSALTISDSQNMIYVNLVGAMTINEIKCFAAAGAPSINIQRNDGSAADILAGPLQCSPTGGVLPLPSLVPEEIGLNLNDKLDFKMVDAGTNVKSITVTIKATVN